MISKDLKRVVYINGQYLPESEAKISIYDSALMFGDMVFEMTRSFDGKQFKLREHVDRLYASARYINIEIPISKGEMEEIVGQVIEMNDPCFEDEEHRIMINVTRGVLGIYEDVENVHNGVNIIVSDFPLRWTVRGMSALIDRGINAVIPAQRAIPADLLEPKVKNRSRIHYMIANQQVSMMNEENSWALMLDPDGYIAEGTGANFFIVKDCQLITPEPRNILRGISRDYVMKIAEDVGLTVLEKNIELYDVMNADEAFFTATPFCILPVTRINSQSIGNGGLGYYTSRLVSEWGRSVGVDIYGHIKVWDSKFDESIARGKVSPYKFTK